MLKTPKNNLESINNPILRRGGMSSSGLLNEIGTRIEDDLISLQQNLMYLSRQQKLVSLLLNQTSASLQGMAAHLTALLPGAPANKGLADFFSTSYIAAENTANIDTFYGQVTLPILSVQERLFGTTSAGTTWVPPDTRVRFATSPTYTPGTLPTDDLFTTSLEDNQAFGDDPANYYLGVPLSSPGILFLKIDLPTKFSVHNLVNRLRFNCLPVFKHTLKDVLYKNMSNVWTSVDISYLPGYVIGTGVQFLGPTQLHFSPTEITQVCIVLQVADNWGIQGLGAQLVDYAPTGLLSVDFSSYTPGVLQQYQLFGQNLSLLASLTTKMTGSKVQTSLTQLGNYISPIVTGVLSTWI